MDPDATLKELLKLAHDVDESFADEVGWKAQGLARGLLALDEWLFKGGFLPRRWRNEEQRERRDDSQSSHQGNAGQGES